MLGRGRKTREWDNIRRILKPRFEAIGLTYCEFRYEGCWHDNGLGFCHIKKRRNLSKEELWVVALGCANCHPILELMKEVDMTKEVLRVIENRIRQP